MKITGVLLDVTGIQGYVFGSNKLKENLGASFLVENVYEGFLREVAESEFPGKNKLDCWQNEPEKLYIKEDSNIEMEVGYIGGGNALLFFRDPNKAVQFVRKWSKELLLKTPGLSTAVAMAEDIDLDNSQQWLTNLFKQLNENKFTHHPQVALPRHGITTECWRTGLSAECEPDAEDEDKRLISSVAASKLHHTDFAHEMFSNLFRDVLKNYQFPKNMEKLGQSEGESHIAIVHIDGNGMGRRFMECGTIEDLRRLSVSVRKATEESMKSLLKQITGDYAYYQEQKKFKLEPNTIPIRPIILGGDDVTFVTDARLGVYFAEKFIEAFAGGEPVADGKSLSACAGVAITKTKYPFYRGYKLAEDLCREAKKKAKDKKDESWLDFHIAYGGFSGEIEEIRQKHYTVKAGKLCYRPYRIWPEKSDAQSFSEFKKGMKKLSKWPRNKQKELREVLTLGEETTKQFIEEMKNRGNILPDRPGNPSLKDTGWEGTKTPYFDMLELVEFYCPPDKTKEEGQ